MSEAVRNFTINLIRSQLNLKPRFCNSDNLCGLSNHHPMMMYSLYYIGASQDRIAEASATYLNHIPKKETNEEKEYPEIEITESNFQEFLGRDESYFNYYKYFESKQHQFQTPHQFLSHYLNLMSSFLYSEAFHCLIRLGFFLEMGITDAFPQILSQIATAHFDFEAANDTSDSKIENVPLEEYVSVNKVIQSMLERREYFEKVNLSGIIVSRMKIINNDSQFIDIISHPIKYEGEKTIEELLNIFLRIFWLTDNFTIMHALNSLLSFQQVLPLMKDQNQAFQIYFKGLISAFLTTFKIIDYSKLAEQMEQIEIIKVLPSFEEIFKATSLSDDDHHAKTVYALHRQYLKYPTNTLLQQKAAQIAKLI